MNAKILAILWVAFIGGSYYIYNNFKAEELPTVESFRNQAQEARIRAEEAEKNRLAIEDKLSQALYDSCYSQAITLSGMTFDEKQRRTYDCWREELTNTNWTGKLAPASEPPSRPITSNSTKNVTNKSTVRSDNEGSSRGGSKVQQAQQTQGKWVATSGKNWPEVLVTKTITQTWGSISKGKETNYWLAYETAIAQIHKWEGLRLSAYWDHAGYSIGYGSRAKSKNEKISKTEADRRLISIVKPLLTQVISDFPNLRPEAQGALVSFAYNCHAGYQSVRKNGLQYHSQWCKTASWQRLGGLVKRRAEESRLIFSK